MPALDRLSKIELTIIQRVSVSVDALDPTMRFIALRCVSTCLSNACPASAVTDHKPLPLPSCAPLASLSPMRQPQP